MVCSLRVTCNSSWRLTLTSLRSYPSAWVCADVDVGVVAEVGEVSEYIEEADASRGSKIASFD